MMSLILPYLVLCLLISVTPGLDTAMVIRSVLKGGRRAGLLTAFGCAVGLLMHAAAVALGLAQLLLQSAAAFAVVKLVGAMLLIALGGRSLWSAYRGTENPDDASPTAQTPDTEHAPSRNSTPFVQGLLCNLTNPKATLFFLAALPQFIAASKPSQALPIAFSLGLIAVLFSLVTLSLVAIAVERMHGLLRSRRTRRIQDGIMGGVLVALGVRVATE